MIFKSHILNNVFPHTRLSYETHLTSQFHLIYHMHQQDLKINDIYFSAAVFYRSIEIEINTIVQSIKSKVTFIHKDTNYEELSKELYQTLIGILNKTIKSIITTHEEIKKLYPFPDQDKNMIISKFKENILPNL